MRYLDKKRKSSNVWVNFELFEEAGQNRETKLKFIRFKRMPLRMFSSSWEELEKKFK